jgi:hypothetical protein
MSRLDDTMTAGTTAHREFRDLDTRRLPTAPPRPGCMPPRETGPADPLVTELAAKVRDPERHMTETPPMSKTATILQYLQTHARGESTAMKPSQISAEVGGDGAGFDTSTVAALLRCAKKAPANQRLQRKPSGQAYLWWWGEPAEPVAASTAEPVARPGDKTYSMSKILADAGRVSYVAKHNLVDDDAVLAAIHATTAAAHLPDADVHARRLRALADSPILDGSIADWLHELADLIDYNNA